MVDGLGFMQLLGIASGRLPAILRGKRDIITWCILKSSTAPQHSNRLCILVFLSVYPSKLGQVCILPSCMVIKEFRRAKGLVTCLESGY